MASTLKRKADGLPSSSPSDPKKPKAQATMHSFFGPKPAITTSSTSEPCSSPQSSNSTTETQPSSPPDSTTGRKTSSTSTTVKPPTAKPNLHNPFSSNNGTITSTFNKQAWVSKLTQEQRELLALEIATLHESWLPHLKDVLVTPGFLALKRFLKAERAAGKTIFPPPEEVYSWSKHTPLHTVKVVILGQDPYHNHNQAHGLCFSVRPPTKAPPSLKNMYTALKKDYPDFKEPPKDGGLLTPWADRGVLLLNTSLTVRAHEASSHASKGWEALTQKVIDTVNRVRGRGVVFLAWGSHAQKRCVGVDKKKHLVLQSVHPSPLSASRGFFDCHHFKKTNDWLEQRYGPDGVIDWNLNVDPKVAGT